MVREAELSGLLGPKEQREEIVLPELEGLEQWRRGGLARETVIKVMTQPALEHQNRAREGREISQPLFSLVL